MRLREFRPTDLESVVALFTASVRGLAGAAYEDHQLQAWARNPPDLEHWCRKIASQNLLLADLEGELLGMVGYEDSGHVGVLFTHPTHARKGVAAKLHVDAERRLADKHVHELFTESSEVVEARGVELHRCRMRRYG